MAGSGGCSSNSCRALSQRGKHEWLKVIQDTRQHLEKTKPTLPYQAVVVDEAQDFHGEEWKLIRAIVMTGPNDLFVVGMPINGYTARRSFCGTAGSPSKAGQVNCESTTAPPKRFVPGRRQCFEE